MADIRLRIFGYAPSSAHRAAFTSWSGGPTEYRNMKVVDDDSYTHVAIYYNGDAPATPDIKHIPKDNVISFFHEPFEFLNVNWDYIKENVGTCIVHDKTKVPDHPCMKEYVCYLPPGIPTGESPAWANHPKKHPMSIVASYKAMLGGHALRHLVIQEILKSDMDIHIWGRGINSIYRDHRVKGSTEIKPEMFAPYKFTIAIENAMYPWFVSEKFYDPLLVNCIPLYWGSPNVGKVFGNNYVPLHGDLNNIMAIIRDVYTHHNEAYSTPMDSRNKILGESNYAHFLWRHFNHDRPV